MAVRRSRLEQLITRLFDDPESSGFGTGWMSGTAGVFLGGLALAGVVAFSFPGVFTTEAFRAQYPLPFLRALLQTVIGAAFLLSATSLLLRKRKVLGVTGLGLAFAATLAGGAKAAALTDVASPFTVGLDWFALNVLLLAVVFMPLERAFPHRTDVKTFRPGWVTDGTYLMINHLAVQALTFLTLLPATSLARLWQPVWLHDWISAQPVIFQFIEIVIVADVVQYWIHRAYHAVPALWRIHAIHHSSVTLDWLAGPRLHVIETVSMRSLVLVPIFLLGFARPALYGYLVFVSFHAVFIHSNVRFRFGWLDHWLTTPRGHHWHHAVRPVDKNFAVHLPVLDRLFGTQYLPPDEWPPVYGIEGDPVPEGWMAQQVYPFRKR
ncbi:MAG: sterol desaturase family protein [Acidobacteria bacterium]|nr:MAG: sterol desaturase family protein [Acidobacteriota bacterium]